MRKETNPIVNLRRSKGLTRPEMARKSNMPYITLNTLENGYSRTLSELSAERLSSASGVDAQEIKGSYDAWRQSQ